MTCKQIYAVKLRSMELIFFAIVTQGIKFKKKKNDTCQHLRLDYVLQFLYS